MTLSITSYRLKEMLLKKIGKNLIANKKHINSSVFLFFINVFNFIFPLLLSPIIISRCGVEGFGVVTMFQSIMLFSSSLTDYGFNVNGTREVTINQKESYFLNQYFLVVNYAKIVLLLLELFFVFIIYLFFPKSSEYSVIFISSIAILLGRTFNPTWFLRAIHKMKFIFYFYVFFKVLSILYVYLYLKTTEDLYLVNLSIGLSDLLICLLSITVLFLSSKWKFYTPSFNRVKSEISIGFSTFIQILSINANSYVNPIILGYFVDLHMLGIYCIVEKIILVIKFSAAFVLQSVFPKACELSLEKRTSFNRFMRHLQVLLILYMIGMGFGLTVFSDLIISYFTKTDIETCSNLLIYSAWIPLIVAINMGPYLTFMVYNKPKPVTHVFVISVVINLVLNTILSKYYGLYGISTGIYLTEFFISISLWSLIKTKYEQISF